jgi:putative transferase (TIGR04331 family)
MERLMEGFRIYIATCNATSFLEALNWNIPTIIFWNPKYNEFNERSKVDFELLKSVGIFHETPESDAKQLLEVWDNIQNWWNDDSLQNVRENFLITMLNLMLNQLKKLRNY